MCHHKEKRPLILGNRAFYTLLGDQFRGIHLFLNEILFEILVLSQSGRSLNDQSLHLPYNSLAFQQPPLLSPLPLIAFFLASSLKYFSVAAATASFLAFRTVRS